MNDEALDALAEVLAEKVLAKIEARTGDATPIIPADHVGPLIYDEPVPEGSPIEYPEPEAPVRNPNFPRPPRVQAPAPVRGVEPAGLIGSAVPVSQPSPHTSATVGGQSTRPSDAVLASWYETEKLHQQMYAVPVEEMPRVSA